MKIGVAEYAEVAKEITPFFFKIFPLEKLLVKMSIINCMILGVANYTGVAERGG